jgi:hypothetical protein
MRTKTLLIAAAALAAAVTSSQAQTVYSQNIVGYVNQTYLSPGSSYFVVAPLTGSSQAADILMASSLQPFDDILVWNGGGYNLFTYVGPGGNAPATNTWDDVNGNPVNAPLLAPGEGFFYQTQSGDVETNTWTGTCVLSNSIAFPSPGASYAVGSSVPISGPLDTTNGLNLPLQPFDGVLIWNGGGYNLYTYVGPGGNAPATNTWDDVNGNPVNSPVIGVGQGFFYQTLSGSTETWTQNDSYINP